MEQSRALQVLGVLLLSSYLLSVLAPDPRCPDSCLTTSTLLTTKLQEAWGRGPLSLRCRCPDKDQEGLPCSWVGNGGRYSFPVCLDAIPTNFHQATQSIFIKHLRSSILMERSFPNTSGLTVLHIQASNVSTIQPGAFLGLPLVKKLYLDDNLISNLGPDTFLGLKNLTDLVINKNELSFISQHAFRGLPLLAYLSLVQNRLPSVPVDALLQPKALTVANLNKNPITNITRHIMLLKQDQHLRLIVEGTRLNCNKNLKWLICNLPDVGPMLKLDMLRCASPPQLSGTLLTTLRKDFIKFGRCDDASVTTTTAGTSAAVDTTTNTHLSIILGGDPVIREDDKSHLFAIITAVAVPLLIVLALTMTFIIKSHCHGTAALLHPDIPSGPELGEPDSIAAPVSDTSSAASRQPNPAHIQTSGDGNTIQPYAVTYMDVSGKLGKNGRLPPYATTSLPHDSNQTPENNDTIQPYAVTYMDVSGKGKNGKLPPYGVTSFTNSQISEEGDAIQPYAVTYMDVSGKGKNGKLRPYATTSLAHDQTSEDSSTIQPYTVTYMDVSRKGKNKKLPPYATTSLVHNQTSFDTEPQLQPYAVTYDDTCTCRVEGYTSLKNQTVATQEQTAIKQPVGQSEMSNQEETMIKQPIGQSDGLLGDCRVAGYTSLQHATNQEETIVKQVVGQSEGLSMLYGQGGNTRQKYESSVDGGRKRTLSSGRGTYGMKETNKIPSINEKLYRTISQHNGAEGHSTSHVLYNTAHGQPKCKDSTSQVLYNQAHRQPECRKRDPSVLYEEQKTDTSLQAAF
uniref:LRRCT domain-containing protein n=1 Tax=Branchiostoma floridae TaxID=7739 RepID=C3Z0L1_BRAFL|eukprot:XP_002597879.1 hypothetical protein BRAFLDRAFT_128424 [Branchiostoma floridae]